MALLLRGGRRQTGVKGERITISWRLWGHHRRPHCVPCRDCRTLRGWVWPHPRCIPSDEWWTSGWRRPWSDWACGWHLAGWVRGLPRAIARAIPWPLRLLEQRTWTSVPSPGKPQPGGETSARSGAQIEVFVPTMWTSWALGQWPELAKRVWKRKKEKDPQRRLPVRPPPRGTNPTREKDLNPSSAPFTSP